MSLEKRPKVSVAMITYNHEPYIEQAVRSVMMQQTDFEYELIIGEDCSTDRTREVLLRLKDEFGARIRLLLHPHNLGMVDNFFAVYEACQGQYIALIEGDDCWIHPRKLQMQIEYMESHPECVISYHRAILWDEISKTARIYGWDSQTFDLKYYLKRLIIDGGSLDFIPTASVIFRRPLESLPEQYRQLKATLDWELYAWLLNIGGQAHLWTEEPHSLYRLHSGGVTHPLITQGKTKDRQTLQRALVFRKNFIDDIRIVSSLMPEDYKEAFDKYIHRSYAGMARLAFLIDKPLFNETHQILKDLSPTGRYIPSAPFHLRVASLLVGYPRAEWLAEKYRAFRARIDPDYRRSVVILQEQSG